MQIYNFNAEYYSFNVVELITKFRNSQKIKTYLCFFMSKQDYLVPNKVRWTRPFFYYFFNGQQKFQTYHFHNRLF